MKYIYSFFVFLSLLYACNPPKPIFEKPKVDFITVAPGVKLEVINWGGVGEPILFLAGLGNSAHIFDEFAPQFNDKYHVYGLTRRGFGASDKPNDGYTPETLSHDILTVLDSLHIPKISLIGHSVAGEEMSKFASLYPERVNKLIYLDAAYDRTHLNQFDDAPSCPWIMTAEDSSNVLNYQNYLEKIMGVHFPLSEIKASHIFDKKGKLEGYITSDTTYASIMNMFEIPTYDKIKAPALALFCVSDSVQTMYPCYSEFDSIQQKSAAKTYELDKKFAQEQMMLFQSLVEKSTVKEFHTNHYLFISRSNEVAQEIRSFLK